jgi:soluble lytic murein transglycosylase
VLLLEQGDPQQAGKLLEEVAQPEVSAYPAQVFFLLGEAYRLQGHWKQAVDWYERYGAASPIGIGSHLTLRLAESYLQLGEDEKAMALYQEAANDVEFLLPQRAATMEKLAQLEVVRQNYPQAVVWYDRILSLAKIPAYQAEVHYLSAQAHVAWGEEELAQDRFLSLVRGYPATSHAYLALRELTEENQKEVSDYQRGMIYLFNADYSAAVTAFYQHIEAGGDIAEAHYYAARAHRLGGESRSALEELDRMMATHTFTESRVLAKGWLEKAQLEALLGQVERAISTLKRFVGLHPTDPLAGEALWRAAKLEEQAGNCSDASVTYSSLAEAYPEGEYALLAAFQAGLCRYRLGQMSAALERWEGLKEKHMQPELKAKVLLWLGKAEREAGQSQKAETYLSAAIATSPGSYYAIRAQEVLGTASSSSPGWEANLDFVTAEREELEAWLESWAGPPPKAGEQGDATPLPGAHFQLGRELLALGLRQEALQEFAQAKDASHADPWTLHRLALGLSEDGIYRLSISCAHQLLKLSPATSPLDAPSLLAKLLYPTYYGDLVLAETEEKGLDPLLLFALMRQESLFDPQATSWAGARGLTQVIPSTGQWIAEKIGWSRFSPDELYRPYVSVEFGAWYLAEQVEGFGGNPFMALAAYNGGPTNSARWRDPDPDIFLENITLAETEKYVRKVYEHYAFYQAIYRTPLQG